MDPIVTPVALTAASIFVGQEAFKLFIKDIYSKIKEKSKNFKGFDVSEEKLFENLARTRCVKTIWQIDKAVDLSTFYCDSHIYHNNKRKKARTINDLPDSKHLLITGIAGQGKSIFLRHMCSMELAKGAAFPLFVELRKITSKNCLKERVYAEFRNIGIDVDDNIFEAIVHSKKLILFLDAFDEIDEEQSKQVLIDLEDMVATNQEMRVIITSRPDYDIERCNFIEVIKLSDLKGIEYQDVIRRLSEGDDWANTLINHIEKNSRHVKQLLCTPLIITLLILSYKSAQTLPTQLSDFYESLFQTLLQRHDGTKPGFVRPRKSHLDDNQCRKAFDTFCFNSKLKGLVYKKQDVYSFAEKAIKYNKFSSSEVSFVSDILMITCLLVCEGNEYRFIHKTVQEYYAACFIKHSSSAIAAKFYKKLSSPMYFNRDWDQELLFLWEIDTYRLNKYYALPTLMNLLNVKNIREIDGFALGSDAAEVFAEKYLLVQKFGDGDFLLGASLNGFAMRFINDLHRIYQEHNIPKKLVDSWARLASEYEIKDSNGGARGNIIFRVPEGLNVKNALRSYLEKMRESMVEIYKSIVEAEDVSVLDNI